MGKNCMGDIFLIVRLFRYATYWVIANMARGVASTHIVATDFNPLTRK
jgi:hypothetical protein